MTKAFPTSVGLSSPTSLSLRAKRGNLIVPTPHLPFILALLALTALLSLLPWGVARSETEPTDLKSVRLWVYPEYDDPRLLVMLEGKIEGASPPATVRFLVPAGAEMYSAGSMDSQGKYSGGPPRRKPSDLPGWDEISYEVTSDTFRVEYYHDIIQGQPDKTIAYEFRTLYPITVLLVTVQEPLRSSDFVVVPRAHFNDSGEGFRYHQYSFPGLGRDETLKFDISYTRSDPDPSLGSAGTGA
ncbi:MAG: hypothetical protein AB1603_06770, partial [Chloroflexota bacterium]